MKIAVTGKGGVGKTTFAATLARQRQSHLRRSGISRLFRIRWRKIVTSMVIKHREPPITLDTGSAINTPSVPMCNP